jgi:hypothetical protein
MPDNHDAVTEILKFEARLNKRLDNIVDQLKEAIRDQAIEAGKQLLTHTHDIRTTRPDVPGLTDRNQAPQ